MLFVSGFRWIHWPLGARGNTVSSGDLDPRGERRLYVASALPGIGKQLLFLCNFPLTVNSLPRRWVTRPYTFVVCACRSALAGHGWLTASAYAAGLRHRRSGPRIDDRWGGDATVSGGKNQVRLFLKQFRKKLEIAYVFTRKRFVRTWKIIVDNSRPISKTAKPLVGKRRILQYYLY